MHCLVVDDHPVTLLGLRLLIKGNFPDWQVLTATSIYEASECIDTIGGQPIGLVLLDLMLNGQDGTTLLSQLRQSARTRSATIVVVSAADDKGTIARCKALGANAYVKKNSGISEIIRIIQSVISDREYVRPDNRGNARGLKARLPNLTSRQKDLLDLLLAGHSNKIMANILNLSYGTVKNYMFDLMQLFSVKSRLELVAKIRNSAYQPRADTSPEAMRCVRCRYEMVDDSLNGNSAHNNAEKKTDHF